MNNDILAFCDKWITLFRNNDERAFDISFGDDCLKLSFRMDSFESFKKAFPNSNASSGKADDLKIIIEEITDPELLGSMLLSQWRYLTHWSMGYDFSQYSEWFIIVLEQLRSIIS